MRIYKTKECARLARKENVGDDALREAVTRAEAGQIDASLGRFLVKQRAARPNEGRSGGPRTVIAHKIGDRAVFLHVFAKSGKANLTPTEQKHYRTAAKRFDELTPEQVDHLVRIGEWIEVDNV